MARLFTVFLLFVVTPAWGEALFSTGTRLAMMRIGEALFERVEQLRESTLPANRPKAREVAAWQDDVLRRAADLTSFGPYEDQIDIMVCIVKAELALLIKGATLSADNIADFQRILKFLEAHGTWSYRNDFRAAILDYQLIRNSDFKEKIAPMIPDVLKAMVRATRYNRLEYAMQGLTLEQGLEMEREQAAELKIPVRISVTLPHNDPSQCRQLIFEPLQ